MLKRYFNTICFIWTGVWVGECPSSNFHFCHKMPWLAKHKHTCLFSHKRITTMTRCKCLTWQTIVIETISCVAPPHTPHTTLQMFVMLRLLWLQFVTIPAQQLQFIFGPTNRQDFATSDHLNIFKMELKTLIPSIPDWMTRFSANTFDPVDIATTAQFRKEKRFLICAIESLGNWQHKCSSIHNWGQKGCSVTKQKCRRAQLCFFQTLSGYLYTLYTFENPIISSWSNGSKSGV